MGASAYVVRLPRLKKVVTSSAVVFDDIPTETPFMSGRPEYWMSPAPGIDDADPVIAEETAAETSSDDAQRAQTRNSTFDGRDIPRPPAKVPEEGQEPVSDERKIVRAAADQLETLLANDDHEDGLETDYNLTDGQEISYDESHFVHCMLAGSNIPMEDAMNGPEAEKWKEAIESEDRGLEELNVITKEDCPKGVKPLKTKYVLTKKTAPNGSVLKFKARKVVQGFLQEYGRDFLETFSPVVGFDTLRIMIKMMVEYGWQGWTMDFT